MASYYVELDGGTIAPKTTLKGGDMVAKLSFSGAQIYPTNGQGGSAVLETLNLSYTPSETAVDETHTPSAGYDGFDEVNVDISAIPSTYVGSGVHTGTSSDVSFFIADSSAFQTNSISVADGYYESVSKTNAAPNMAVTNATSVAIDSNGDAVVTFSPTTAGIAYKNKTYSLSKTGVVSVKGAQTYTPTTSDQTISANQLLTGAQTILGDANLIASNIVSGVTIFGVTGTAQTGGVSWVEQTIATDGAVTQALDPYTLYHFTGNLTSLTITLNAPSAGEIAHYHFDFGSGSTAPTLNVPVSVTMPDDFSAPEANNRYEVDILNNYGTVVAWATA